MGEKSSKEKENQEESQDRLIAAELFGVAPKPKVAHAGGHVVDPQRAVASFEEDDDAVIRVFCRGCGRYIAIIQKGAEALAKEVGEPLPDILSGSYFEAEKCVYCSERKLFEKFELKHV